MSADQPSAAYECPVCGFVLWLPLYTLRVSTLGLYDDARFPGRCILALHDHYEDLSDVEPGVLTQFIQDTRDAGRAIRDAVAADRMNYAVLGNTAAHVHFHLIPRVHAEDPIPLRPPWEHPLPVSPLSKPALTRVSEAIVNRLANAR